ncbi:B3 domain-containing protein Os03g0120900-like [Telopea speciosissima]|uniref:B3 domain-containing protein Os03g0120900-like n=1 Tax=Telopea speciosissima TaxID=54955 RepID=UPI001CC8284A|nr:B3 domain-containing protein Os03g0120900-like [Telopea speciosissima]XP_043715675.1 B3 domain-containing protein Os03g0120900-like [Telopea speciosissima]
MDFAALGRDGLQQYDEEDQEEMIGDVARNPMFSSCSSSSSSPSPSSNYSQYHKGLIPQQNLRWGSQAYDKQLKQQQQQQHQQHQHHRVWLGTFENEEEVLGSTEAEAEAAQREQDPSFSPRLDLMDLSSHHTQSSNSDADAGDAAASASAGCGDGSSRPGGGRCFIEREHMFDKVVTPSDVGKLNRLVIPKQHAEKYFPLDSTINEKGLLLSFEDRNGKPWRFRYSYWNSSQSYVMTKGWSRFVKEKKLDAGDIVSFERGVGDLGKDHLFIDWRHRPDAHHSTSSLQPLGLPLRHPLSLAAPPPVPLPWSRLFMPNPTPAPTPTLSNHMHFHHHLNYDRTTHDHHHHHHLLQPHLNPSNYSSYRYSYSGGGGSSRSYGGYNYNVVNPGSGSGSGSVFYLRSSPPQPAAVPQEVGVGVGVGDVPMVIQSVPVVHGRAAAKRVRLFGVNLECPTPEDDPNSSDQCELLSSTPLPNTTTTIMPPSLSPHHLPLSSSFPPLELRVYSGAPLPQAPAELPRNNSKQSLSFNLDI